MDYPILMTKEYWMNTPLSTARNYGGVSINGKKYEIVNKYGESIIEISMKMVMNGEKGLAIDPSEPADLILQEWIPVYKKLGRDKAIELINNNTPLSEAKKMKK